MHRLHSLTRGVFAVVALVMLAGAPLANAGADTAPFGDAT